MPDVVILLLIIFTMPIWVFLWEKLSNKLCKSKYCVWMIVLSSGLAFVFTIYLSLFLNADSSVLFKAMCVITIDLVMLMLTFPVYYPLIEKITNKSQTARILEGDKIVGCYINTMRPIVLANIYYRIGWMFLVCAIINFTLGSLFAQQSFLIELFENVLLILALLILLCFSIFSVLIKCPNCKKPVFDMNKEYYPFFEIPKKIIKERVLHCKHCKATYALNASYSQEELECKQKLFIKNVEEKKALRAKLRYKR